MPSGSSMNIMMQQMPDRCFDVGIAEQHAVTFSAGLATNGLIPFCNVYSTFFQRAYDQVIHDVCLQNLHVVFCLDRAGVVGEDGPTHHGVFDIAFLRCIPNLTIMAPSDALELRNMMFTATKIKHPVAIRYPKGQGPDVEWEKPFEDIPLGKGRWMRQGTNICIVAVGTMVQTAMDAANLLTEEDISVSVVDARFIKPLDTELLDHVFDQHQTVVTIEDGCRTAGFGSAVIEYAQEKDVHVNIHVLGYPDEFVNHASREELLAEYGLDVTGLAQHIRTILP